MIVLATAFCLVLVLLVISLTMAWDKVVAGRVPFIVIPHDTLAEIVSNILIKPSDTFYDLGCGDGRVLLVAAQKQPKATYVGVEKAIWPYLLAKYRTRKHPQITIRRGDIAKLDLPKDALIFCYLLPELVEKINFAGHRAVSVQYDIPGAKPYKTLILKKHSRLVTKVLFYKF